MIISFRKSFKEITESPSTFQTFLAQFSNSGSCVTPRSKVMGSNFQTLGVTLTLLGSPPSRCVTGSVDCLSALTLLTPATYLPSHLTRNLKFLYGSNRYALTTN